MQKTAQIDSSFEELITRNCASVMTFRLQGEHQSAQLQSNITINAIEKALTKLATPMTQLSDSTRLACEKALILHGICLLDTINGTDTLSDEEAGKRLSQYQTLISQHLSLNPNQYWVSSVTELNINDTAAVNLLLDNIPAIFLLPSLQQTIQNLQDRIAYGEKINRATQHLNLAHKLADAKRFEDAYTTLQAAITTLDMDPRQPNIEMPEFESTAFRNIAVQLYMFFAMYEFKATRKADLNQRLQSLPQINTLLTAIAPIAPTEDAEEIQKALSRVNAMYVDALIEQMYTIANNTTLSNIESLHHSCRVLESFLQTEDPAVASEIAGALYAAHRMMCEQYMNATTEGLKQPGQLSLKAVMTYIKCSTNALQHANTSAAWHQKTASHDANRSEYEWMLDFANDARMDLCSLYLQCSTLNRDSAQQCFGNITALFDEIINYSRSEIASMGIENYKNRQQLRSLPTNKQYELFKHIYLTAQMHQKYYATQPNYETQTHYLDQALHYFKECIAVYALLPEKQQHAVKDDYVSATAAASLLSDHLSQHNTHASPLAHLNKLLTKASQLAGQNDVPKLLTLIGNAEAYFLTNRVLLDQHQLFMTKFYRLAMTALEESGEFSKALGFAYLISDRQPDDQEVLNKKLELLQKVLVQSNPLGLERHCLQGVFEQEQQRAKRPAEQQPDAIRRAHQRAKTQHASHQAAILQIENCLFDFEKGEMIENEQQWLQTIRHLEAQGIKPIFCTTLDQKQCYQHAPLVSFLKQIDSPIVISLNQAYQPSMIDDLARHLDLIEVRLNDCLIVGHDPAFTTHHGGDNYEFDLLNSSTLQGSQLRDSIVQATTSPRASALLSASSPLVQREASGQGQLKRSKPDESPQNSSNEEMRL